MQFYIMPNEKDKNKIQYKTNNWHTVVQKTTIYLKTYLVKIYYVK